MSQLPLGWTLSHLDACAENLDSRRVPVNSSERAARAGEVPYYGATGQVGWIDRPLFNEELVLLGEDGAPFLERHRSKAYLISGPSWVNNHAHVLRGRAVSNRYLMHFLNSIDYHGLANGTTRLKLTQASMNSISVPVAPQREQERIVESIEEQFSRLDAGVAALAIARTKVKRMRAAVLREAIEGRLAAHDADEPAVSVTLPVDVIAGEAFPEQPRNWTTTTIAGIASVTSGATPSRRRSDYWTGGSIPWVTSTLLNAKTVQRANEFVTPRALADTSIKLMLPGTLLVAMYGEGQTRGRCSELLIEATTNQACAAIVVRDELVQIQPYIKMFLIASYEANRRRSVGGVQPNLSVGAIKDIRIALPPMREQARILSEADRQLASLDQLEHALVQQEHRTRSLRSSILAAAFSGDLVPQDPGEEPAADVLHRIAAGRAVFNSRAAAPRSRRRTPPEKITA